MDKKFILAALLVCVLLVSGCVKQISEIKSDKYIDEQVTIRGTVVGSIKIGDLSGFTLKDESGEIFISSNDLPSEESKITKSGIVKKIPIINTYYIDSK
ncbi:MAG: hypothetical protein WC758_01915 [Candidatus Woesearchaeota archaeon]|jgi:hypothetical protein